MEHITSRRNPIIQNLRLLARDASARKEQGVFLCDGVKLLKEAVEAGQTVKSVFWKETPEAGFDELSDQTTLPGELFDYVSPLKNSPGPLFLVKIPSVSAGTVQRAVILENVQDPGNVGTIIRCANAMKIPAVILCGDCADLYHPRTVRATMGAIFRQTVLSVKDVEELSSLVERPIFGAALTDDSEDIRKLDLTEASIVIGSEGHGISEEMLYFCDRSVIIPMNPDSESLNAASAASILMWEMSRSVL